MTDPEKRSSALELFKQVKERVEISRVLAEEKRAEAVAAFELNRIKAEQLRLENWRKEHAEAEKSRKSELDRIAYLKEMFRPGTVFFTRNETQGTVLDYSKDASQYTYMHVLLNEDTGERKTTFIFPDSIDKGFIHL